MMRLNTRRIPRRTERTDFPSKWRGLRLCLLFAAGILVAELPAASLKPVSITGTPHYDLAMAGMNLGMKAVWTQTRKKVELRSRWTTLKFEVDARYFELNNRKVYLARPLALLNGRPHISQKDYLLTIRPILAPQTLTRKPTLRRIVLDAGHGGRDFGAQNTRQKLREKDLTLDVAYRLKRILEGDGFQVFLTRKSDHYIPLDQRGDFANRVKADLFVSIHFNSIGKSGVQGLETYLLPQPWTSSTSRLKLEAMDKQTYPGNKDDGWNSLVGFYIHKTLVERLGVVDRGLKRSRFKVLKNLQCPGLLVELGFISHPNTAQRLRMSQYRAQLAASLARGIQLYRNTQKRLEGKA